MPLYEVRGDASLQVARATFIDMSDFISTRYNMHACMTFDERWGGHWAVHILAPDEIEEGTPTSAWCPLSCSGAGSDDPEGILAARGWGTRSHGR